jgi:methionyl-tRNA formyltransferase
MANEPTATKPYRVLFFCGERSPWGFAHLKPLLTATQIELVAIVLATDRCWDTFHQQLTGELPKRPRSFIRFGKDLVKLILRRQNLSPTAKVHQQAARQKIPVITCDDVNSAENITLFQTYQPDFILAAAYPQFFKTGVLTICPNHVFNSHPSLLPKYRGAHPIFWVIASGETKTGGTIHQMTSRLDQGDIIAQLSLEFLPSDTYVKLYAKLINLVPDLVEAFLTALTTGQKISLPQDPSQATYFRNDRKIHHSIFWPEMTAEQIYNLVRACNGQAYFWVGQNKIAVHQVSISSTNRNMTNNLTVPPGTVVDQTHNGPVVAAKKGYVCLEKLTQPKFRKFNFQIGQVL